MAPRQVDLSSLQGMLWCAPASEEDCAQGDITRESTLTGASQPKRKSATERAEQHRQQGNELFRLGAFVEAVEAYTSAINASPRDARSLSNRSASFAALKKYREAFQDASAAVECDASNAKAWSRKGLAAFYLGLPSEAKAAYAESLRLDPGSAAAQDGLRMAAAAEAEAARRREAAAQAAARAGPAGPAGGEKASPARRPPPARGPSTPPALARRSFDLQRGSPASQAPQQPRSLAAALSAHESAVQRARRERRESLARWRASVGAALGAQAKPEVDRDGQRSVRVDVFGTLRGACARTGCGAWRRDVGGMSDWSDTSVLSCEGCGAAHAEHDDCGCYPLQDPPKPAFVLQGAAGAAAAAAKGIAASASAAF